MCPHPPPIPRVILIFEVVSICPCQARIFWVSCGVGVSSNFSFAISFPVPGGYINQWTRLFILEDLCDFDVYTGRLVGFCACLHAAVITRSAGCSVLHDMTLCVFQLFFSYCGALLIPEKICCFWDGKVFCYLYSGYINYFLLLFLFESDVFNSAARSVYLGNKKGQQHRVEWVFYFLPMRLADVQVLDICHCTPKSKPTVHGNMFWDISWPLCKYVFSRSLRILTWIPHWSQHPGTDSCQLFTSFWFACGWNARFESAFKWMQLSSFDYHQDLVISERIPSLWRFC